MDKKVKEPFFLARIFNMIAGMLILGLILLVLHKGSDTDFYKMLIFALACVMNFVAATISFSERKRMRGNVCAILSALFMIGAVVLALRIFVFV